jgi:hypothetical protein
MPERQIPLRHLFREHFIPRKQNWKKDGGEEQCYQATGPLMILLSLPALYSQLRLSKLYRMTFPALLDPTLQRAQKHHQARRTLWPKTSVWITEGTYRLLTVMTKMDQYEKRAIGCTCRSLHDT